MTLLTINEQDTINTLAINIVYREREIHQYQININNYTLSLETLPQGPVPEELLQYIDTLPDNLPEDMDIDTVMLISQYSYRKRINQLLRTEKIEQSKSKNISDVMKAQLPADTRNQLILNAAAVLAAQESTQ